MPSVTQSQPNGNSHYAEWRVGYRLRNADQPISACQNATQRRGWRDAEISLVGATLWASGVSAADVDIILAGGAA